MLQILCFTMFLSILLPLSRNLTPSLRTTLYIHELRRWQTFSLFALSELVCTKNVIYPILWFLLLIYSKLLPLWSITDRQTDRENSSPPVTQVFFSLSTWGPTCRCNSTGLAELWGGWPIKSVPYWKWTAHFHYLMDFQPPQTTNW